VDVKTVLNIDDGELVGFVRLVALESAIHCDRKRNIRIGQKELAELIGISRVTVGKAFNSLEDYGLIERMGHGHYRLSEANGIIAADEGRRIPQPKGVEVETERLKAIRRPDQSLCYREDGWPVLRDIEDEEG